MDVRVMDAGAGHPERAVTSRSGNPNQLVNSTNGRNFGNDVPTKERRLGSHILFDKK